MGKLGRKKGHEGYWKGKTFDKPSVFKDVDEWIGWPELGKIVNKPRGRTDRMILKFLFETGARVSELIKYKSEHFKLEPSIVRVVGGPLVKNDQLSHRWEYWIERSEPLVEDIVEWIDEKEDWLFPSNLGEKPYLTRQYVWKVAREESDRYPHWFRSMRAFCLSWFHDLELEELKAWFTWTDPNTPQHYARPSPRKIASKFKKFKKK